MKADRTIKMEATTVPSHSNFVHLNSKMKLIILAALVGYCAAAAFTDKYLPPVQTAGFRTAPSYFNQGSDNYQSSRPRASLERNAHILRSESDVNENGYNFSFETDNGIQAHEIGQEANGIQAQGGYSYTGDDGHVYNVRYTAGNDGFQVQGDHIPTPPPLPEEIARALELNARDEAAGIFDDGSYHEGKYANDAGSGVVAARFSHHAPSRQYLGPQSSFKSHTGYQY